MGGPQVSTPLPLRRCDLVGRAVRGLDRWLDGVFPVAIGLLCLDARYPAYVLLLLWLVWRLALQVERQPLVVIFLLLLGAQAGQFVLERDLQPSSVSDPLVIALGFVAMVGRQDRQWRTTLAWVSVCTVPLMIWALGQDPAQPLDLPVGGINRLGFLLGVLQLASWASAWMAGRWWSRAVFACLGIGCVTLLLHNGSRVALLAPALAVLITVTVALVCRPLWLPSTIQGLLAWRRRILLGVAVAGLIGGAAVVQHWYLDSPATPEQVPSAASLNVLSDRGRVETALCWARQPLRRGEKRFLFGLGHNAMVQRHCGARQVPSMRLMRRPEGLPHAHNLFAQIAAENGLLGVLSLGAVLVLLARQAWITVAVPQAAITRRFLFAIPLLVYLALNATVSSFQLFLMSNQLLIGLGLASLWPARLPASAAAGGEG